MKKVEVVAAIIIHNDLIFCAQRGENKLTYISNKFEFPGGKIESGETKKEALKRELIEELNITPEINNLYLTVNHTYPDFELTMHSFICKVNSTDITLNEHISGQWLSKEKLSNLDWAAADLPIVKKLMNDE
ncbi:(deoxy)nucleoside triphosphate pyrophosphohydrolase [Tenacibaculum finnmarkense genomovar finnmarkense]|uniref:(deoxy)nucleoside triphosphate pyrophosphohydrolase n=1 Tax=Tenacibaculum finnmarkense TaxID=2781243 RepID=UPI000C380861|nr:(deoxy)nucleoside triphosphate pyrophosphohydrolase [Tenacibaculum finnmarkense]MCD8417124.1 (deoxy)nucleoside triphosphate pyrophosphohydrolase [Tenacibaculum finnmarkense genomovar finnmarkense]MCD8438545.1 (deoxy)nucleoside triphosphate pyrophosphohydrolase [Tenacibaculum finnmarkense genomovar ulcerans]MCG8184484.1 (deoxy)nucleoside triphosphate pyrophosphohydrolase [Tenacibaculum finnmarkense genomovar finnmarkense]MCG8202055.1 (deoxy)nucleoside triphosphate pyrophosphohydrolase [Tenaci